MPGALAMGLLTMDHAMAQQPGSTGKKIAQAVDKFMVTEDGWQIAITYRNSILGQDAPAVVLLPRLGNDRLVWKARTDWRNDLTKRATRWSAWTAKTRTKQSPRQRKRRRQPHEKRGRRQPESG
jgi:hypothetical protein